MKDQNGSRGVHEQTSDKGEVLGGMLAMPSLDALKQHARPLLERTTAMVQNRPYLTLGIAVSAGVLFGVSMFSRVGRIVLLGAMGLGAELLHQSVRVQS
jgi:hypothetical protein